VRARCHSVRRPGYTPDCERPAATTGAIMGASSSGQFLYRRARPLYDRVRQGHYPVQYRAYLDCRSIGRLAASGTMVRRRCDRRRLPVRRLGRRHRQFFVDLSAPSGASCSERSLGTRLDCLPCELCAIVPILCRLCLDKAGKKLHAREWVVSPAPSQVVRERHKADRIARPQFDFIDRLTGAHSILTNLNRLWLYLAPDLNRILTSVLTRS